MPQRGVAASEVKREGNNKQKYQHAAARDRGLMIAVADNGTTHGYNCPRDQRL